MHRRSTWNLLTPLTLMLASPAHLPPEGTQVRDDQTAGIPVRYVTDGYMSADKRITVERFEPMRTGKHPVVIMIHGAAGLFKHEGKELPAGDLSILDGAVLSQKAPLWLDTLSAAVDYAWKLPGVDKHHIGLLGESLGGYLAVALAARDWRIVALSEFSGGMPDPLVSGLTHFPPTLIQHGENDTLVPVQEAYRLEQMLRKLKVPCQIQIYSGQGHYFDSATRRRILDRTRDFFRIYLRRASQ
jgi:dienelactone hydrolase